MLAYVGVVVVGSWLFAPNESATWTGLVWLALLLFLPALALTLRLVNGLAARSHGGRAGIGAAASAGWLLLVTVWLVTVGQVVGRAEVLGPALLLAASGGAVLGAMGPWTLSRRSRQMVTAVALVVALLTALVVLLMADRWGSAA